MGNRGWLKPPPPEEGVDFKSEAAVMKKILNHRGREARS